MGADGFEEVEEGGAPEDVEVGGVGIAGLSAYFVAEGEVRPVAGQAVAAFEVDLPEFLWRRRCLPMTLW